MTDPGSVLESYQLPCCRCGRADPDTFGDLAALDALFMPMAELIPAVIMMQPVGIRTVHAAEVARCGPAHYRCQDGAAVALFKGSGSDAEGDLRLACSPGPQCVAARSQGEQRSDPCRLSSGRALHRYTDSNRVQGGCLQGKALLTFPPTGGKAGMVGYGHSAVSCGWRTMPGAGHGVVAAKGESP